jgi:hypothetical protein
MIDHRPLGPEDYDCGDGIPGLVMPHQPRRRSSAAPEIERPAGYDSPFRLEPTSALAILSLIQLLFLAAVLADGDAVLGVITGAGLLVVNVMAIIVYTARTR